MENETVSSCQCKLCRSACESKPGWFKPDQIEAVMKYFKVKTVKDLLGKDKFAIDWWCGDRNILILAPNIKGNDCIQYPNDPRGECVFYKNEKCEIYDIRPFECAVHIHSEAEERSEERHNKVSKLWATSDILEAYESKIDCQSFSLFDKLVSNIGL